MRRFFPCLAVLLLVGAAYAQPAAAPQVPLIDTHVHFQSAGEMDFHSSLQEALRHMDQRRIAMSLLMSPPRAHRPSRGNYDVEELLQAIGEHRNRFAVLGGGGSLTQMIERASPEAVTEEVRRDFRRRAEDILAQGAVGFGEMFVQHLSLPSMGAGHPYENVPADHPLMLLLADIAAERGVPVDVHCDLVPEDMPLPDALHSPPNPAQLRANRAGFERLLAHNRRAPIIWSHVGFEPLNTRDPQLVREMLAAHPNLYMSFRINRTGPRNTMAMDESDRLKPGWMALIREFPDRFMLGSDVFYARQGLGPGSSVEGLDRMRALVGQLPRPLARRVAFGNAQRLYKLDAVKIPEGQQ